MEQQSVAMTMDYQSEVMTMMIPNAETPYSMASGLTCMTNANSAANKKYLPPNEKIKINEENFNTMWRSEYDSILVDLVPRYKNDWKKISKKVKSLYDIRTTPNFLRQYFVKITADKPKCPSVKFDRKLDATIAYYISKLGLSWVKIAKAMNIGDAMKVKNRYYSQIKKKNIYDDLLAEAKDFMNDVEEIPDVADFNVEVPDFSSIAQDQLKEEDSLFNSDQDETGTQFQDFYFTKDSVCPIMIQEQMEKQEALDFTKQGSFPIELCKDLKPSDFQDIAFQDINTQTVQLLNEADETYSVMTGSAHDNEIKNTNMQQ